MIPRLLVTGSMLIQDRELVFSEITKFMFAENDTILVASIMKDKEYRIVPYEFPLAVEWMRRMWRRSKDSKKKRYSIVEQMCAPKEKSRKLKGNEVWFSPSYIRSLVRECTHVLVFWKPGSIPERDRYIWKIADLYGLEIRKVLV